MDCGLKTLLLDSFRKDDVPREVRLDAAQGHVAPRGQEQLALLVLLVDDADAEVRSAAAGTLAQIPPATLAAVLARADTPAELVRYFGARGVTPVPGPETAAVEDDAPLVETPAGNWDTIADDAEGEIAAESGMSVTQQIQQMNVVERVRAAMKGSREVRALHIRDPNKMESSAEPEPPRPLTPG